MFLNLGNIRQGGRRMKFNLPFSLNPHYNPEVISSEDKQKAELSVGHYFAHVISPHWKIDKVELAEDDSNKGPDLILSKDGEDFTVQVTRLTFNNFPERRKRVKSISLQFAELINQQVQPPFRVLIRIMPKEIYRVPLSSLKRQGKENLKKRLLQLIINFLTKSIPQLQAEPKKEAQEWIKDPELAKYFDSIDIQQIPPMYYPHVEGCGNAFIDYYAYNPGYSDEDVKQTIDRLYEAKNNGKSDVLIIWTNDYELIDRDVIAKALMDKFVETSFQVVFFMSFTDGTHMWTIKQPIQPD